MKTCMVLALVWHLSHDEHLYDLFKNQYMKG